MVAVLALVVTGVASAALGVALDRYVLLPRQLAGFRTGPPDAIRQQMRDRMARELSLTPEQQTRIDSVTARNFAALEETRRAFQPRMDSVITSLRASMDSVLTPAQRARLDSLRERDAFGPPLAPFGRGGPMPLPPPGLRVPGTPGARRP